MNITYNAGTGNRLAAEEKNTENLLVIKDKALAGKYTKNWQEHAQHSESYAGRGN